MKYWEVLLLYFGVITLLFIFDVIYYWVSTGIAKEWLVKLRVWSSRPKPQK